MALEPFETAYAAGYPTVQQLSVFLPNRVGELMRLTRLFGRTEIHILALTVINAVDCAIIRMIVDEPQEAQRILSEAGFTVSQTEILVVSMPAGKRALLNTWAALLGAEVNVAYTYALLVRPLGQPALAVQSDHLELSANTLQEKGFRVLDQSDLAAGGDNDN